MLMPYRTLADPETQGEGSIDPLGLATLADRLADWILPGMTARMWRPRFLTAMAVTFLVVEPMEDELARDGLSPPWLVLEWHYVEAMAAVKDAEGRLRRLPGIDKARQALRDGVPMNADRYLKTPKVFGFHGVYKRLGRHLDIVDDGPLLGENGYRLLRVWEEEQGLEGFADPERPEGDAVKIRRVLRDAVREAMEAGHAVRSGSWPGAAFFVEHLAPNRTGRREAAFLWELLVQPEDEPRGEIFRMVREPALRREFAEDESERQLLATLRDRVSIGLGRRLDAIEAYEGFCRPLQEAWDRLRYLSTIRRPSVVQAEDVARDARSAEIARMLGAAIEKARDALAESPIAADFEALARQFGEVRTGQDLFHALWTHHREVQRRKPPEGKRPWFEETADGALVVRPPYRADEVPPREEYVHPYRLFSVSSFIDDLWGAA
jgi:hypothetical protein